MGQSQSTRSNRDDPGHEDDTDRRADYYELLGLERDASEEDIKKAYRRKALELHPDRNYGNVDAATKLFADVQCAYEVLSDPQERAWYDTHQHADLSDDGPAQAGPASAGGFRMTTSQVLSLVLKFNPHMEFSDSPNGFFGGLRDVFDQLATDEEIACRWDGSEPIDYPSFGSKDDSFEDVVRPFYAVWTSFSTKKPFTWKDKYKYSEAPDRRIRRLMEKENKKMREDGIREYNDAVRSLVAFVKKRDPRYKTNIQTEAERQRMLRESAAAQAARSRAANQAKLQDHVIPEWARTEEPEEGLFSSSESEVEHFECVVCNKTFKSQKQFDAHERSKKHIKAVKQLRREMLIEDDELNLDDSELKQEFTPADDVSGDTAKTHPIVENEEPRGHEEKIESSASTSPAPSPSASPSASETEDQDYTTTEDTSLVNDKDTYLSADDDDDDNVKNTDTKSGKAKQKRAKKLAAQQKSEMQNRCAHCQATFSSRTQLFSHLRETGHAQPVQTAANSKKKKGKSNK